MDIKLFSEENKQWEKAYLAGFELDIKLFEQLGLKIVQIVPDRNSFRLETDRGFFSLKKLRFPEAEMDFVLDCIKHLKDKGFNKVLGFVSQAEGKGYKTYNGDSYYLTQWVDGRECDFMNSSDIIKGAELIAELHQNAKGFKPANVPGNRNFLGKWPQFFKSRIDEISNVRHAVETKDGKTEIDAAFVKYLGRCIEDAEKALGLLVRSGYGNAVKRTRREGGFIHHDLLHNSLVYTFPGEIYFIDFESFAIDIGIHDIASFILRSMKRGDWNIGNVGAIIESYNRICPIRKNELDILVPYMLFPQDFWQNSRQYFSRERYLSCKDSRCYDKDFDEAEFLLKIQSESEHCQKRYTFIDQLQKLV